MDSILKKNLSYLFILQNFNYLIPLILLPYLTHTLGVDNFGKIAFAQAFITYFILITDFGFNTSATQNIVRARTDKAALSKVFWSITLTKSILGLSSLIVLIILLVTIPKLHQMYGLLLISAMGILSTILFPVWLFQGLEKMSHITLFNVIPRVLVLTLTFIFIKLKSDYALALLIQSAGTLLSSLACTIFIFNQRIVRYYNPNISNVKSTIVDSWHIFASSLATNIYTTTNTVVLGFLSTNSIVGVFSASEKLIRAIISLFSSISQVTFPRINTYYQESIEKALNFGNKVLKYTFIATFITGLFLLIEAPLIVRLLFGTSQFAEVIIILRLSSFIPFFATCNGILATNFLITFGLKKYLFKVIGIGGLFSLMTIVPSVIFYQARGVAIVATMTEILITIMLLIIFKKHHIKIKF
jgi:PST family polysaccharide transporter